MVTFSSYSQYKRLLPELSRLHIAHSKEEHEQGLMGRSQMDSNEGMLFVYPKPSRLSFWMKNTLIPLDIAFINASGVITEIEQLHPKDETHVISSQPCKFALEVNRGWFQDNGYNVGDKLLRLE